MIERGGALDTPRIDRFRPAEPLGYRWCRYLIGERGAGRRTERNLGDPRERSRRIRVGRLRRLPPWRHLPDQRHALVELAHPVDQAALLRHGRRPGLGRQPLVGSPEELGEPAVGLQVAPDHDRVVRLERLCHPVDERPGEAQRDPHLADGRPCPVRHEVADHPGVLGSVAVVDVLDDLLPPLGAEVDVDVGVGRPSLVDEPLEQEVVLDRLDPADAERVGHDRAGRAAAALRRDRLLLGEPHQVPADQEELGEAGPFDDVELVGQAVDDGRGERVVAATGTLPAQLRQVRERRLVPRHREAGEAVLLEAEVDPAGRREIGGAGDPRRPGTRDVAAERPVAGRESHELVAALQVGLAVGPPQVRQRVQRPAVADRGQDVLEFAAFRSGVVDVVRHDDRQGQLSGECHRFRHEPVVVRQAVMRQLEVEAILPVPFGQDRRRRPRALPIAGPQPAGDLALPTAGQRDQALGVLRQQGLFEPGHRLRPGEIRPRHEPAQAAIARRVARQEDEVRSPLPVADPALVLLDGLAMTRQPSPIRTRSIGLTLAGSRVLGRRGATRSTPTASKAPARRGDDPLGIGGDRVAQLDLDAEHRPEADLIECAGRPDDAVQALVVGDRETGQAELDRPLGELVRRRGAVEEREVGVAVELGIGDHRIY